MSDIELSFNPDSLTLGDLEDFEDFTGQSIDEAIKPVPVLDDNGDRVFDDRGRPEMGTKVSTKALIALVWLVKRADEPTFTVADARKVRVSALKMTSPDEGDSGNE
ncbi:hypothetical protein AB0M54_45990 [Actinoplanes sp. NPDC051470]|uniref:hypothetical protein n=1 Tax=Actinoplanes sp. NPDC051470 TaxID=3157224 RepID=UPI003427BD99